MRKSILLAVALMVALVAVPASASVQNVKVSGSIDSTYLYRDNFDLGLDLYGDETQSLFLTQTILRVDADLTDQVSTTVALINERAWDQTTNTNTDIDLLMAYVTLREMLYSPLTVVVGRQAFNYGNSLVVDSAGTNNVAPADSALSGVAEDLTKQTNQDAIRLIFDYNPLTLEFLYSKIDANTLAAANDDRDDIDLYGLNTTYELGDEMNTQVEAYFFARIDQLNETAAAGEFSKSDTTYVPGLRASADVLDGLNIQGEVAWQRGNRVATTATAIDNEKREAFAAQFISNYQVPNDVLPDALEEYNPILNYTYTYVSGDSNPNDRHDGQGAGNTFTAWDPMFENQGGGTVYNALFNLTNLHIHTVSFSATPIEDVTTKVSWHGLWLDKKLDPNNGTTTGNGNLVLVQPDSANGTNNIGAGTLDLSTSDDDLGYEIDFEATYDYTEDVRFGANLGWFVPGDVFLGDRTPTATDDGNGNNKMASQVIVHGNVNF